LDTPAYQREALSLLFKELTAVMNYQSKTTEKKDERKNYGGFRPRNKKKNDVLTANQRKGKNGDNGKNPSEFIMLRSQGGSGL